MRQSLVIITISTFLVALSGAFLGRAYCRADVYPKGNAALSVLDPEIVPLAAPSAQVKSNDNAEIDYSNAKDGYVRVKYTGKTNKELRAIVKGPDGESYTYELNAEGIYEVFPLSVGNGSYQVGVYENIKDTKYSTVISAAFPVALTNEFVPFLRPNQYVNYSSSSDTVKKASEILKDSSGVLAKITTVYNYVMETITYDKDLAKNVQSGYLPDVDSVLKKRKGICFDYAAVMTTMLRSQQIPTKLVVGYAGKAYHAWISVYSKETGWVGKEIHFDGASWTLMDPTFASSNAAWNTKNISYTAKLTY